MFCRLMKQGLMNRLVITRFTFPVTRSFAWSDREHDGRLGGGVCFYARSSTNYSLRPDLSIQSLKNLCIEIRKPRTKPFLIATWCKPPSSSTEIFSYLETLIGKLDSENAEFDLMGDFNCNFASSQPDNNTVLLSNLSDVYGLHQLINTPNWSEKCFLYFDWCNLYKLLGQSCLFECISCKPKRP